MNIYLSQISCGVLEAAGFHDPREPQRERARVLCQFLFGHTLGIRDYGNKAALLIWSDRMTERFGQQARGFAEYLEAHGLATVSVTDPVRNGNSGNQIGMYTATLNRPALIDWYNETIARPNRTKTIPANA